MEVIRGSRTYRMRPEEFRELTAGHARVVIDIGTGDGRFVYSLAQAHSEWFCIGLDPARENLARYSSKLSRKLRRRPLSNVLCVIASAEDFPSEMVALADYVYINFPWSRLLQGVVLGDHRILTNVAALSRPGGSLEMLLNTSIYRKPVPKEVQELPRLTLDYVDRVMTPAYSRMGLLIVERRALCASEMRQVETTWGRRLAYGRDPSTLYVRAEAEGRRVDGGLDSGHQTSQDWESG